MIPKFDPKELNVVREIPPPFPGALGMPVYDFPVSPREAYIATMKREPVWQITNLEYGPFCPHVYPDNVARGFLQEANKLPQEQFGGKDMFGIEWVYVEKVRGSMVKPGSPLLDDINEWKDKVEWPDIEAWDWAASAEENKVLLNNGFFHNCWIMNGYFERLISFMDFEGAALALIDEDQKSAIHDFFTTLTDLYIRIVDKFVSHFHVEGFHFHDDWGSQQSPFFSIETAKELIVPYMKRLTEHIHYRGAWADIHSCGCIERQIPNIIAAGWDSWDGQAVNDTQGLYEKYGDKIIIRIVPDQFGPDTSEEDQRAAAREYVKKFCSAKKPSIISMYGVGVLTPLTGKNYTRLPELSYREIQ
ncbi:MAG: hypothetical protein LBB98_07540 [Treponema sp.]|jgi:hypothetical protein|nr:hypothetical protein [Treponema sp.]